MPPGEASLLASMHESSVLRACGGPCALRTPPVFLSLPVYALHPPSDLTALSHQKYSSSLCSQALTRVFHLQVNFVWVCFCFVCFFQAIHTMHKNILSFTRLQNGASFLAQPLTSSCSHLAGKTFPPGPWVSLGSSPRRDWPLSPTAQLLSFSPRPL